MADLNEEQQKYLEWGKLARKNIKGFMGAKMSFVEPTVTIEEIKNGAGKHATQWQNMRPICPYGCGEEGSLMEIIMRDGKAIGIYTHSNNVKPFTADLQMSPKPTGRKIVIGPDGEPTLTEEGGK